MTDLFTNLLLKFKEKYRANSQPIVGLLLLKSNENDYHLCALRTSDNICDTNNGMADKWTQALYMCASFDDKLNVNDQIPVEKWQLDNPNCRHKTYREISDLSDLNVESLSRNQIRKGHSGMWFKPARAC